MSLEVKNLYKSFGQKVIFSNFSYSFPDKGVFTLVGNSGIGKTTLLRLIAGLDKEYAGKIIGGRIGCVSFAFQEYRLFPTLNAIENVYFANSNDPACFKKARELLLRLNLTDEDMKLYPSMLSGGMKQRVSIARALMKDAPILLLDEPTKELDHANRSALLELIKEEGMRRLVILVSHNSIDADELKSVKITIN